MAKNDMIARLRTVLGLDTREFEQGERRARKKIGLFEQKLKQFRNVVIGAFSVLALKKFADVIAGTIARVTREADRFQKLGTRLGVSTNFLSELQFVAERTGQTFESVTKSIERQVRRVGEAAEGNKTYAEAFRALNLEAARLRELSPEQQFSLILQRLSEIPNKTEQVRIAFNAFGREGVSMLQAIEGGAGEIIKLRNEARHLGATVDQFKADKFAAFADSLTNIKTRFAAFARDFAEKFIDVFNRNEKDITDFLDRFLNKSREFATILIPLFERLGQAVLKVSDLMVDLAESRLVKPITDFLGAFFFDDKVDELAASEARVRAALNKKRNNAFTPPGEDPLVAEQEKQAKAEAEAAKRELERQTNIKKAQERLLAIETQLRKKFLNERKGQVEKRLEQEQELFKGLQQIGERIIEDEENRLKRMRGLKQREIDVRNQFLKAQQEVINPDGKQTSFEARRGLGRELFEASSISSLTALDKAAGIKSVNKKRADALQAVIEKARELRDQFNAEGRERLEFNEIILSANRAQLVSIERLKEEVRNSGEGFKEFRENAKTALLSSLERVSELQGKLKNVTDALKNMEAKIKISEKEKILDEAKSLRRQLQDTFSVPIIQTVRFLENNLGPVPSVEGVGPGGGTVFAPTFNGVLDAKEAARVMKPHFDNLAARLGGMGF